MRRIIVTAMVGLAGLALALGQVTPANDERAVRAAVDSYTSSFNNGNLDAVLAHVAADVDFIDDGGKQYNGKADLGQVLKQSLADLKGSKLKTTITSVRFLRPDVAVVDGKSDLTSPEGTTDSGRFTSTWTKADGKWLLSCVRNLPDTSATPEPAAAALHQLEWLIGDWTHEEPNYRVQVNGRWALNQSFLVLEYTARGKDSEDLTVLQFFGWDPADEVIRSWFFDSKGGNGGGDWERDGNIWNAEWSGVLSDGRSASSVNSMQFIDDKTFVFRSSDREIDGLPLADLEVKFVRKATEKSGGAK
ncbi:MAG TPA: SgcJ/EcaC family oxidoreductase [Gemmataceae bacterium]|nr:SgcJ/EcaC family oxidoreductase [Gemmataceae bacterium]